MTHDLALAAAVWAVLALLSIVTLACMGRAAHAEDVRLGYDAADPAPGHAPAPAAERRSRASLSR